MLRGCLARFGGRIRGRRPRDPAPRKRRAQKDDAVDQLKFDSGLGVYAVSVEPEQVLIMPGLGSHVFQIPLEVAIPEIDPQRAGQLLTLDLMLCTPLATTLRKPLAMLTTHVAFKPSGETRRPILQFIVSNAQLLALEQQRVGDLRLELVISGYLPGASGGFPGSTEARLPISLPESKWRQQLADLGRTLGVEMTIPFPPDDDPRRAVADFLREAQRQLGGNEIDSAMLNVRKALEKIREICGWDWPGKKDRDQRTAGERWAVIRAALEDQASGAMHGDAGTKDHVYSRREVEALIALAAGLLSIVP
jgi:hypothetical protein